MSCHFPIPCTQDPKTKEVTLHPDRPSAEWADGDYLEVACGQCPGCKSSRVRSWAIRAHHESQMHTRMVNNQNIPNGCFITLTYNDEHLPEDGSLDHKHWQLFAKKLRHHLGNFRYLQCGEYGTRTERPHYHGVLFGIDFNRDRTMLHTHGDRITWESQVLTDLWGKGFTTLSPLNFGTAAYTAGYVVKKLNTSHWEKIHGYIDSNLKVHLRKSPYINMSRRPGLGEKWFLKYWTDVYPADRVRIEGKSYRPPKYYDDLLLKTQPLVWDQVMNERIRHARETGPTTENTKLARAAIFAAQANLKPQRNENL